MSTTSHSLAGDQGGGVIADRETIRLDRSVVTSDLDELFDGDDDRVVQLGAGAFLPEDRYEYWAAPMRAQVRSTVAAALRRRLASIEADAADSAEAQRLARRYDELDAAM